MKNIYLIGFMGTGKSAVGSVLAEQLGMACVEMDRQIETQQNMTITEIFERYGETYFPDSGDGVFAGAGNRESGRHLLRGRQCSAGGECGADAKEGQYRAAHSQTGDGI